MLLRVLRFRPGHCKHLGKLHELGLIPTLPVNAKEPAEKPVDLPEPESILRQAVDRYSEWFNDPANFAVSDADPIGDAWRAIDSETRKTVVTLILNHFGYVRTPHYEDDWSVFRQLR